MLKKAKVTMKALTEDQNQKKKDIVTPALLVETRQIGSQQHDIKCKLLAMTRGKLPE